MLAAHAWAVMAAAPVAGTLGWVLLHAALPLLWFAGVKEEHESAVGGKRLD